MIWWEICQIENHRIRDAIQTFAFEAEGSKNKVTTTVSRVWSSLSGGRSFSSSLKEHIPRKGFTLWVVYWRPCQERQICLRISSLLPALDTRCLFSRYNCLFCRGKMRWVVCYHIYQLFLFSLVHRNCIVCSCRTIQLDLTCICTSTLLWMTLSCGYNLHWQHGINPCNTCTSYLFYLEQSDETVSFYFLCCCTVWLLVLTIYFHLFT